MASRKNGFGQIRFGTRKRTGDTSKGRITVSIKTRKKLSQAAKQRNRDENGRFI